MKELEDSTAYEMECERREKELQSLHVVSESQGQELQTRNLIQALNEGSVKVNEVYWKNATNNYSKTQTERIVDGLKSPEMRMQALKAIECYWQRHPHGSRDYLDYLKVYQEEIGLILQGVGDTTAAVSEDTIQKTAADNPELIDLFKRLSVTEEITVNGKGKRHIMYEEGGRWCFATHKIGGFIADELNKHYGYANAFKLLQNLTGVGSDKLNQAARNMRGTCIYPRGADIIDKVLKKWNAEKKQVSGNR